MFDKYSIISQETLLSFLSKFFEEGKIRFICFKEYKTKIGIKSIIKYKNIYTSTIKSTISQKIIIRPFCIILAKLCSTKSPIALAHFDIILFISHCFLSKTISNRILLNFSNDFLL